MRGWSAVGAGVLKRGCARQRNRFGQSAYPAQMSEISSQRHRWSLIDGGTWSLADRLISCIIAVCDIAAILIGRMPQVRLGWIVFDIRDAPNIAGRGVLRRCGEGIGYTTSD